VPAVHSPQEAREQLDLGAGLIKFCLGGGLYDASYVKATFHSGPIHFGIPLLLTGGVRPEKVDGFVGAGMLVAVVGFDLILKGDYEGQQDRQDDAVVRDALGAYVEAFAEARARHLPHVDFASGDAGRVQEQSGRFMGVATRADGDHEET
jgi:2-keto-3-deoxy-6-phosphogluconate aldolase